MSGAVMMSQRTLREKCSSKALGFQSRDSTYRCAREDKETEHESREIYELGREKEKANQREGDGQWTQTALAEGMYPADGAIDLLHCEWSITFRCTGGSFKKDTAFLRITCSKYCKVPLVPRCL